MANREKYQHRSARDEHGDQRNYIGEATALVKGLSKLQRYELYEICCEKMYQGMPEKREKELLAVRQVLEGHKDLDRTTLAKYRKGRSEMARDARERDGRTTVNRKKV
jgi:hypothetical protein